VLAAALEKNTNYRAALNAYKASLALVNSREVQAAFLQLKSTQGFRITEHTVDADSATRALASLFRNHWSRRLIIRPS
jgi:RNA-splicing ligase RtcB